MVYNAEFWVAVAFVLFLAIVWKVGGFKTMLDGLDARGKRVTAELEEAKRLREEAAAVLAEYKKKREDAERQATEIVAAAREEAERNAVEAHKRLDEFIKRRTAAAETKIAQAESQAAADVRAAAADAAVKVSEVLLRDRTSGATAEALMTKSLQEVRAKLN